MKTLHDLQKSKTVIECALETGAVPTVEEIDEYRTTLTALADNLPVSVRRECSQLLRSAARAISDQFRSTHHSAEVSDILADNHRLLWCKVDQGGK